MIVFVTGGRDHVPTSAELGELEIILRQYNPDRFVHGGASGVDTCAGAHAYGLGFPVQVVAAEWKKHGRAAGPIRNRQMVKMAKDEGGVLVAFPGGRGTADCIAQAKRAGVDVIHVGRGEEGHG